MIRICQTCVMDETAKRIQFSGDTCSFCAHKVASDRKGFDFCEDKLRRLVEENRRLGFSFDCVIGVSGGMDSSSMVYRCVKDLGLRPLLFHVDAGWNSAQATRNIYRLVKAFDLELFTVVVDWDAMREFQIKLFESGTPHLDTAQDHVFFSAMRNFILKNGCRVILTGANMHTEGVREPLNWHYFAMDSVFCKSVLKNQSNNVLERVPYVSTWKSKILDPLMGQIKVFKPLDLLGYNRHFDERRLVESIGYEPFQYKHHESLLTKYIESIWLPQRFNIDKRKAHFSSLIVSGQMTRSEALEQLSFPALDRAEEKWLQQYVQHKLRIDNQTFKLWFDLPKRTENDFANLQFLFLMGARLSSFLGRGVLRYE